MNRFFVGRGALVSVVALAAVLAFGVPNAFAAFHGVAPAKTCNSPTPIGQPYLCSAQISNIVDSGHDTIEVQDLNDVVNSAGGSVPSGSLLASVGLIFSGTGAVTCTGGSGAGTSGSPYIGATDCLIAFGGVITTTNFSHYTVQPGDFNILTTTKLAAASLAGDTNVKLSSTSLAVGDSFTIDPGQPDQETRVATFVGSSGPGGTGVSFATPLAFAHALNTPVNLAAHRLSDTATWDWNNTCVSNPDNDCTTDLQHGTAGASSVVQKLNSSTATTIHNAAHGAVTAVAAGSSVHDFVTVTGQGGSPNPSGNVTIDWLSNVTDNAACAGTVVATSPPLPLNAAGQVDASSFSFTPPAGHFAFRAHYAGDATYLPSDGPCEPLTVVDARISISPNGTNEVNHTHTFTAHVDVNNGSGFTPAPDGTQISFTVDSGPGSFNSANPCTTTGGTGSCQIGLTSAVVGVSTVSAHTTLTVGGVPLTRDTNGAAGNSGPATKVWVDANIQITPATATNATGTNHVLTITVNALGGTIDAGGGTATASIVSGPGGFVGSPTCSYSGGGATASCTVTISSSATGTTVVSATSNIPVNGVSISRTTGSNPGPGGSGNASKVWVDANIQITPATATNPIGTNHVLTITVNALGGTIDAAGGTATASIISGPGGFVGSPTCTYSGGGATASCTVTITSNTPGTTVVQATSNIRVSGQTIPRTTATNPGPGGSGNASKLWLQPDANIQLTPGTATNAVGTNHTLHCHINVSSDSTTYTSAPNGTVCTVTITSGPGTPTSQNCSTTGGTGTCDVTITSSTAGTTTLSASTTVTVNSVVLTRSTNGTAGNSGPATKTWVDANIQITPATANNPVGTNHVLTITVNAVNGTIDAGGGTATASILSGPGSFVGSPTCSYTGGGATASCTVTISSTATGTTVVQATSNIPVSGQTVTRTTATNPGPGGSGNASKNWADDTVVTHVRDAANNDITNTTVSAGTVVHDEMTVAKAAGTPAAIPNPTGTVDFTLYSNGTCDGTAIPTASQTSVVVVSGTAVETTTFTTPATGGTFSFKAHYSGDSNYPPHDAACEPFTVQATPQGQITPTNTSCTDFTSGTAQTLTQVNYSNVNGAIGQGINPGVFFFYSKITTTQNNQVVTIGQTNNSTNNAALFGILNGQAWLWTGDCSSKIVGTTLAPNDSGARFVVATPGTYIISLKYQTKSIAGTAVPVPPNITYTWTTSLGGSTGASLLLKKQ